MFSFFPSPAAGRRLCCLLAGLWLAACAGHAQAPAWAGAATSGSSQASSTADIRAVAADASGNVFVTGIFRGQMTLGTTSLTSRGSYDLFVAKYVPGTATWAWAVSGGGTESDEGYGIAVSGNSVYVVGTIFNDRGNSSGVLLGGPAGPVPQAGASSQASFDLLLAKYTDLGTSAALQWSQVGGGTDTDTGQGVAVSGSSVYVVGNLLNTRANTNGVVFGGTGTTPGTVPQAGASFSGSPDIVLAKYTDNGSSATFGWSQVAGGSGYDTGQGVAVSGSSIYVVGSLSNTRVDSYQVLFGGTGTSPGTASQAGTASSPGSDLVLAAYTDQGSSAAFRWSQVGGGASTDAGRGIAANGSSVYVTGILSNDAGNSQAVVFGGAGTTAGTVPQYGASSAVSDDVVLAKYTDNGSAATLRWTQVGGGTSADAGRGVAVSGSSVYVTGYLTNSTTNYTGALFGGTGTTAGTAPQYGISSAPGNDVLLAKYTDAGSSATLNWTQVGGGDGGDLGYGVAVSGQSVLVGGTVTLNASFGSYSLTGTAGRFANVLARVVDATLPLGTHPAAGPSGLVLYPNPSGGNPVAVTNLPAGSPVQVLDALGRTVATATADATGTARVGAGLAPGLYVVRSGRSAGHLAVQ